MKYKINLVIIVGGIATLIFSLLWKFEVVDEPTVAIISAIITIIISVLTFFDKNTPASKSNDKDNRHVKKIIQKNEKGDNFGGNQINF